MIGTGNGLKTGKNIKPGAKNFLFSNRIWKPDEIGTLGIVIGTVYGFENRKTVETVRKKIYGFGYGFKTVQNRKEKNLRFCLRLQNRKEKNLRF